MAYLTNEEKLEADTRKMERGGWFLLGLAVGILGTGLVCLRPMDCISEETFQYKVFDRDRPGMFKEKPVTVRHVGKGRLQENGMVCKYTTGR